jgi:hypothetical protein
MKLALFFPSEVGFTSSFFFLDIILHLVSK